MSDDPAAVDESAPEPTDADAESDAADTAGTEPSDDDSADEQRVDELVDEIATADDDLAEVAHELGDRIAALEDEVESKDDEIDQKADRIEELTDKLSRERADFQNYKKRMQKQKEQIQARATEDLIVRVTDIRENLVRALDQDEDADIRPGVESTLEAFDDVLAAENVEIVEPEPGEEVDPERHEVMLRVDSDQPDGTVVDVYQNGYEMAGKVLQPAQVTVSSDDA
ncbi:MAG: nucleotide exchange factor GrpE [Halohasta sp.]